MSVRKKKKQKAPGSIEIKLPEEDFVPYVCHYNPNTILTKDGELVQIIRVSGFHESVSSEIVSLREAIRKSILDHVKENGFAMWFTTIRRKKNIVPEGKFDDPFCNYINEVWIEQNSWDNQYVNELYISIISEGLDTSISNFQSLIRSLSYGATKKLHSNHLTKSHERLSNLTSKIIEDISDYGARLLGMREWNGVLYSEPMRLFGKITNLYEDRYPVNYEDISQKMLSHYIVFGDYDIEVLGKNNKNYATMLSLKEYSEIINDQLDNILQLPFEFIITQSFDFIQHGKDLENYKYQDYILNISNDYEMKSILDLESIVEEKKGLPTDYGEIQTSFMIISHEKKDLEKDVSLIIERFSELGVAVVRENIFAEHCFWSQLPANFAFIRRQKTIDLDEVAGFAALYNFPAGKLLENHWGPAATVLHTVLNTPYFFSFHDGVEGHSMILGDAGLQKNVLLNFLISQSQKFNPKIFYFDFQETAKCFINLLNGQYYKLIPNENIVSKKLTINPIKSLKDNRDTDFLISFFVNLANIGKNPPPTQEIELIKEIIPTIIDSEITELKQAIQLFDREETKNLFNHLQNIYNKGIGKIFDGEDEINWQDRIIAIDLTEIYNKKALLVPLVDYLLHQMEKQLDGNPAIIVFNEAWELLDNDIIATKVDKMLTRFKEKNCVTIFSAYEGNKVAGSKMNQKIIGHFTSKFIFPEYEITEVEQNFYENILHMTPEEINMLGLMNIELKQFLLKHGNDSVVISLDFPNNIEIEKLLATEEVTKKVYLDLISENPDIDKVSFLKKIFDTLIKIEKDKIAAAKEELRQKRLTELKAFAEDD